MALSHPTHLNLTVIDQEFEISVPDQFVTVENDALFRCQLAPQAREFLQVVGWLEDGTQVGGGNSLLQSQSTTTARNDQSTAIQWSLFASSSPNHSSKEPKQVASKHRTPVMLPDGQLFISRVQLRDANKSFRCQVKNQLNGRVKLSSIGGRLFVTGEY